MYDTNGPQAETTTEQRKPPTLADIVREKTDDGRRIVDFFLDVMEDRIDGAELCHRIDAAKQLVKYGSKDAARFIGRGTAASPAATLSVDAATRPTPAPTRRKMPRRPSHPERPVPLYARPPHCALCGR